jgi:flagellar FliL protein
VEEDSVTETPKRPRKLLWLMIGLLVLSIGAAAAAAYLLWSPIGASDSSAGDQKKAEQPLRRTPIFLDITPFTVNINSSRGVGHLLYIGMSFKVGNIETRDVLEEHMPQVRSRLLIALSGQKADELTSVEGKQQLASQLIAALQSPPLAEHQPELALEEVLFTDFIVD